MQDKIIIRKAPDGFYIAGCPLVPEAHAKGKSYEECLANFKEVLRSVSNTVRSAKKNPLLSPPGAL
jgi:predicted RNase H-like HicB family nuclease